MRRMVQYQEVFQRMWEEDKMIEQEKIEEERRERRIEAQRRTAAARRNKSRGPTGPIRAPTASSYGRRTDDEDFPTTSAYRPTRRPGASPFGPEVDDALDTMPPSGPQRDEWIRTLASMTQEQRQANYQRVDDEDDEEEYWGGPT
ncbi:hypothetical protein F4805DRAFT_447385 [Annulohypoxylon moriforme]|nr:hypothetical protein F4805DRAFT_447385 [Annulohypoxylon moriforme]